jgi:NADH-quinone oxidoreductase subunit E
LIAVCREKIAPKAHQLSADGRFSWEEVECLGACANAPMAQIGKDYYEDLTAETLRRLIDRFAAGEVPVPGPQNGRYSCEPLAGLTSLKEFDSGRTQYNASVQAAVDLQDTVKRIDGTEVPLLTPWLGRAAKAPARAAAKRAPAAAEGAVAEAPAKPRARAAKPAAEGAKAAPRTRKAKDSE